MHTTVFYTDNLVHMERNVQLPHYLQIFDEQNEIDVHTGSRNSGHGTANCAADRRCAGRIHEQIPAPRADKLALSP